MARIHKLTVPATLLAALLAVIMLLPQGCGKKADNEIVIGAVLPLSGPSGKYGQDVKAGMDLALKEINSNGGIEGKTLKILYEDTQADPSKGVSAARKLIDIDGVSAIIGAMSSTVTLAIAPVADQSQVVLLSFASSSPDITSAGDFIFRNCVSDSYEGSSLAAIARDSLGFTKVAILRINNDYGKGIEEVFKVSFEDSKHKVVISEMFDADASDFRSQLAKIKAANPDCLLLVGYSEMINAFRQKKEMGIDITTLSTVMLDDQDMLDQIGDAAEGTIFTTWRLDTERPQAQRFKESFHAEFGSEPGLFVPEAYDAVNLIAVAIRKGGYSAEGIRDGLYGIRDYEGVTGETSFDENGDVEKSLVIEKILDGKFVRYRREGN